MREYLALTLITAVGVITLAVLLTPLADEALAPLVAILTTTH